MCADTEYKGWHVKMESGPGVLGSRTFVASADREKKQITAHAYTEKEAREMIQDMISKRPVI